MANFIYEDVVEKVAGHILDGSLKPGDRVPSLRRLSRQINVSVTSAMRAYGVLEDRGLIESRPKSGYFVRPLGRAQLPELTDNQTQPCECLVDKGQIISSFMESLHDPQDIYFGCASPNPVLLPLDRLARLMSRVCRQDPIRALNYEFPPGSVELRRQVALTGLNLQCRFSADDVITTNGCMEALHLSLRAVTQPGDQVLIESPTYFNVLQLLENLRLRAVALPAHPCRGIDPLQVEAAFKTKPIKACLLIPSFNNPLGACIPAPQKMELVELATRYGVPLIEDDIYGDLYLEGSRPQPLKSYDRDAWVLLCSSFSKTLAPGLRVGWVASERFNEELKQLQFMSTLAPATPNQIAVAQFIQSGHYQRHLKQLRNTLRLSLQQFTHSIQTFFPSGTRMARPQGGFVLWIALPPQVDSFELYRLARTQHISLVPGPLFSPRDEYRNCIRLTYAHPFNNTVEQKLEILGDLAKSLC